ncbi:mechanosensitive ion channel family protein [Wenzhouxiangella limi]|uniref:Small-conductance mechanosensitive channel n=1 Tax=Wenzhouxiangella limi TaxID=2707351 RepID=A0A845UZZ0_9GAMM|nr:mechanosensitive ion channel domain-containing protein [Wenzhouxiangella limi]NDY96358.1 mechanosensitive ion channel [Wenzhouxiangella limi]
MDFTQVQQLLTDYNVIEMGTRLIGAILIFFIGRWIGKRVVRGVSRGMEKRGIDALLVTFVGNILGVLLLVIVIMISLGHLGVQVTPLIAVLGGMALAVGLALQSSLSNFAAGIMLVILRPFTRGHFVEAGGVSGTVQSVGIFNTQLQTPDNRLVIVGNSDITGNPITNYSAFDTRRIDMIIGVSYDDDLKLAQATMQRVIEGHEKVLAEPEPAILLMELGESSVDFAVRPWVLSEDYWTTRSDLLETLKTELEAAGCSIPFPQRDIHHFNVAEEKAA